MSQAESIHGEAGAGALSGKCRLLLRRIAVPALASLAHLSGVDALIVAATIPSENPPSRELSLQLGKSKIALLPLGPADMVLLDSGKSGPRPVGTNRTIPISEFARVSGRNSDAWDISDAGPVWRLQVESPGAEALRVRFRDFSLGKGRLWIHSETGRGFGPYSETGSSEDGEFWSPSVEGETVFIEFWPARNQIPESQVPFRIDQLGHLWESLVARPESPTLEGTENRTNKPVALAPRAFTWQKLWARSTHALPSPESRHTPRGRPVGFFLPEVEAPTIFTGANSFRFELRTGAEALAFEFRAVNNERDVDLFVRFGLPVEVTDGEVVADYRSDGPTGQETIVLSGNSDAPLRAGTYFLAFGSRSLGLAVEGTLVVTPRYNNESCFTDVVCRDTEWGNTASAVALIVFSRDDGLQYSCSGALVNDKVEGSFIPYFLTAAHCIENQRQARSVEAHWFYQNARCSGSHRQFERDPRYQATHGAELLAREDGSLSFGGRINPYGDGDIALLKLAEPAPRGTYFLGWTSYLSELQVGRNVVGIHHSESLHKQISFGKIAGTFFGARSYEHMTEVDWGNGLAITGASGSPLLNEDGRIIGVLSGGRDDNSGCFDPGSHPVYSNFRSFYSEIEQWLAGSEPRLEEIVVELGTSGDTVTITVRPDGSYWIGDSRLIDGTLVTASNGNQLSTAGLCKRDLACRVRANDCTCFID